MELGLTVMTNCLSSRLPHHTRYRCLDSNPVEVVSYLNHLDVCHTSQIKLSIGMRDKVACVWEMNITLFCQHWVSSWDSRVKIQRTINIWPYSNTTPYNGLGVYQTIANFTQIVDANQGHFKSRPPSEAIMIMAWYLYKPKGDHKSTKRSSS